MKGNKLSIDDWVLYQGEPSRIRSVTRKKIGISRSKYNLTYIRLPLVEQIPLTKEILLKNKFTEREDSKGKVLEYFLFPVESITAEFKEKGSSDIIIRACGPVNFAGGEIRYVNELQQILRFCGITLDIEP